MDGSAYVEAGMASSASDAGADATPFSCAQQTPAPDLCDDFESYDALNAWPARKIIDPLEPEPAGGIDLDNRAARAGQGSLLAVVNPAVPTCAGCDLSVCTEWAFWELQGHQLLTIEFDMSVEQVDPHPGRRSTVFRLVFGSPEIGFSRHMLQLRSTGSGTEAAFVEGNKEAQPAGSTGIPASLERDHNWHPGPPADWVHVKYVLDAVNSGGLGNSVQVHMGKVELTNRVLYYALRYREPFLELGLPFVYTSELVADETNESWRVRFDNLLVRREQRD
jgi:hypothetical protein